MTQTITGLQAHLRANDQIAIVDGDRIRYVDRAAWDKAQEHDKEGWANLLALAQSVGEMFNEHLARLRSAGLYAGEVRK